MLIELRVQGLLLIERAEMRFGAGLNVLTGETGAGKTILAHALDLLLGGRARAGIVRPGAGDAYVEGSFTLDPAQERRLAELLPDQVDAEGGEIVLARRLGADGRTRAYLNGRSATVADLRRIGPELVAFYGQHEHRKLTVASSQLEILDSFCGSGQGALRDACAAALAERRAAGAELERLRELTSARESELELLRHELAEIERIAPVPGEHARLVAERDRLRVLDSLRAACAAGLAALDGDEGQLPGAAEALASAAAQIDAVGGVDRDLEAIGRRCGALALEARDLATELRGHGERLDAEEGGLQAVEERLAGIERLMRRHGGDVEAVLAHAERSRARLDRLAGAASAIGEAQRRLQTAQAKLERGVQALRKARARAAPRLAAAVREQLACLAMPDASFDVRLAEREPTASGGDAVELMLAPNPGVAPGPLREIASGGELSRAMLALSVVSDLPAASGGGAAAGRGDAEAAGGEAEAAAAAAGRTLVFDEVDAGIGGHTARAVGERLRDLAGRRQIICITHLPQIASLADRHFAVVKDTGAAPARATVRELEGSDLLGEMMRMLGASDGDAAARRHAEELLKAA